MNIVTKVSVLTRKERSQEIDNKMAYLYLYKAIRSFVFIYSTAVYSALS